MLKCEVRGKGIKLLIILFVLSLLTLNVFSDTNIWNALAASNVTGDLEVNVDPWISVTIPTNTVTLDLNPSTEADFDSANLTVTVATNNEPGYTLSMSPSDNTSTSLTRRNGVETIQTLADLSGGYTEQTFTTNRWGYKLSSGNYLPFNTTNEIGSNDSITAGSSNTVTFASKIDGSVADGTYELEITFTAVGNIELAPSMQDLTLAQCPTNEPLTVRDVRDNQEYKVQKLADGKCWLLDNLALDLTDSAVVVNTTASNTNATTTSLNYLKNGGGTSSDKYAVNGLTGSNWATGYSDDDPLVAASGNCQDPNYCANVPTSGKWTKDSVPKNQGTEMAYGAGSGKVGVYYNYCAASAGSYCYEYNAGIGNATEDICPAGWRIPTGGNSGEYSVLYSHYNTTQVATNSASLQFNLSTPLSGTYDDIYDTFVQGYGGNFWSSTRRDGEFMYILYVYSTTVDANGHDDNRYYGNSVRCILDSSHVPGAHAVTVSMDGNTSSVTFSDGTNTQTATSASPTVNLVNNTQYTITANFVSGYELSGWTVGSNTTIGSLSANPTTLTVTGASTLQVSSQQAQAQVHTIADGGNMQDVSSVAEGGCPSTLTTGQVYQLTDNRGTTPETYNVARLADGKCWMVENLNLAGGTALSATDTNVDSSYINSFTTSRNLTKTGDTIVLPASSTSGFDTNNYSYVYNSGNKTNCGASGQNTPCYSYYSWDAATLGSGRTISTEDTDAPYSICPKGWRLPTAYDTSATNWQTTSDFYVLAHQDGVDSTTPPSEYDSDFYNQAGPGTVPNFLLAGNYSRGSFYSGGSYGIYWSATSGSNANYARYLNFDSSLVNLASNGNRYNGFSVRCLLQ